MPSTRLLISSTRILLVAGVAGTMGMLSCGKTKKTTSSGTTSESVGSSGSLAVTYPEGMSVSSSDTTAPQPSANDPQTVAYASGSLAVPTTLALTTEEANDPTKVTPKQRILDAAKRLKGEADDCLPGYIFNPVMIQNPACYSPDGDMAITVNGNTPGGLTTGGEACLAAVARTKIAEVSQIVDQAQALVEGMICAAYKENKKQGLPKINETLDLAETLTEITGATKVDANTDLKSPTGAPPPVNGVPPKANFRIAKAEIKRLDNTADRARFLSNIVMEVNGLVREIRLMHMPSLTSGNNDYVGRLSIKTVRVQRDGLLENRQNYLDINYMMDLDTEDGSRPKTRYRLIRGMFNHSALQKMNKDPFAGIGQLDLNVGAIFDAEHNGAFEGDRDLPIDLNRTLSQVNQIDYAGNPITNEGRLAFWINPGGNYNEAARGLVADRRRESPESTRLVGCAVSGAAKAIDLSGNISIRKAQREKLELKPTGYFHPTQTDVPLADRVSLCANGQCQVAPYVYKQCYRQDDAGLYKPDKNTDTINNYDVINFNANPKVVNDRMPVVDGKIQAPQ